MEANYPRWDQATGAVRCKGCKQPIPPGGDIFIKSKSVYYCNTCGIVVEAAGDSVKVNGIEEGLIKDLERMPPEAADTSIAKSTLMMARQLDYGEVGPREITQYTKEIRLNYLQLLELFPSDDDEDDTEQKRAKHEERRRREQGGI
jgi:hypothetical protein